MPTPSEKRQNRNAVEAVRVRMRKAVEDSGMTLEEIGLKMGFAKAGARQAVSRILTLDDYDPRLSTLVAFCAAVGKPVSEFVV